MVFILYYNIFFFWSLCVSYFFVLCYVFIYIFVLYFLLIEMFYIILSSCSHYCVIIVWFYIWCKFIISSLIHVTGCDLSIVYIFCVICLLCCSYICNSIICYRYWAFIKLWFSILFVLLFYWEQTAKPTFTLTRRLSARERRASSWYML